MSVFRGSVRQRQMMPTLRLLIDGFMFGLPVPVLGTLALCAFQGHVVPGAALFLQARSPLLKTADCVPFVFALCACFLPGLRRTLSTIARDIPERKSVEAPLLNAEALFRSALSAMQEGFLVQDVQGKVLMVNKHAEEILGLVHDEMIGQAAMRVHWSAIHANGLPFAREDHPSRRVLQTGLPHPATMLGLNKPGQPLQWLSVSASPLFHPGETSPYAAVSTFTDITAQKAAADALRQSQERLQTVVGNAPVILFSLDTQGILTTSEGRGLELLGQKPGQVVGQSLFDLIGDDHRVESHLRQALAGESVSYVSEMAGYQWDNQLRPLLGASGVESVIGISFDVTDRHQAEEILRRGEERLRSLYEITANPELAFKEKMERLMQMGCLQFGMQAGILAKMDETLYEVVQSYTPGAPSYQGLILPVKNTLCHEAILSGEPLGIENISASSWVTHPACQAAHHEAYLGTEVLVGDKSFGALCFTAAQPHAAPFTAGDKDLLRLMAQWVGSEMLRREAEQKVHDYNIVLEFQTQEMERANRELEGANAQLAALAATDGLTGLCNHRTLGERLAAEFERARRYNSSLSLLMMDVDQFKQYNDAFGHQAGDFVLQTVGQILDSHARITDLAARYGGEEFAVVLPETDAAGALVVAERIRHAMECHEWPQRAVTMSIGVCTWAQAQPLPMLCSRMPTRPCIAPKPRDATVSPVLATCNFSRLPPLPQAPPERYALVFTTLPSQFYWVASLYRR